MWLGYSRLEEKVGVLGYLLFHFDVTVVYMNKLYMVLYGRGTNRLKTDLRRRAWSFLKEFLLLGEEEAADPMYTI